MIDRNLTILIFLISLCSCSGIFERINPSALESKVTSACVLFETERLNVVESCIELRINEITIVENFSKKCLTDFKGQLYTRCTFENVKLTCNYPQNDSGYIKHFYYNKASSDFKKYEEICRNQEANIINYDLNNYNFVYSPIL